METTTYAYDCNFMINLHRKDNLDKKQHKLTKRNGYFDSLD